jgi:hypothetical protein
MDIPLDFQMNILNTVQILSQEQLRWLRDQYYFTHILPSEYDFFTQINNIDLVYLVLYWNNLERLYPRFIEEEMDLDAIRWMTREDLAYFL